ncbi:MAG: putative toxin-antitoxin system toxin component, PIN family [Oscillatoriales cyanobacterium RU_3_3]|nr:putative toxin-antitoxin system toxin component, PIN family [Microcoleus sp. SU_5_6]NJL67625.1 putative toxin-antitoxin system toxin component, PIN family [Microcoleus sp. SM1_3_4]NJM64056.1 putative toxin-antitoxin system toxin component, PIN family [Oscillatoriales cyanobacterium RU_3_3]NJS42138.1 putative toxin-antitoxin system toxin component, PIN family [Candidatus Gracilibacteria bacterium]
MSEIKFVLDSNVLVSAALFKNSIARQAFNKATADGQILMSDPVLAELQEVFSRPRFDKYLSTQLRMEFLTDFLKVVEIVEITESIAVCRDPKDDKFLELAISGQSNFILSGDKDLLVLHPFGGIEIVTPADFLTKQF